MVNNLKIEGQLPAKFVEKRPKAEGNAGQTTVTDTQGSKEASSTEKRRSGLEKGKMLIQNHFDVTWEELKSNRRGDSSKVCVHLIKRHNGAPNREIAELFGNLSYSAVAKIDRSVSSRLAADDDLRGLIERMPAEYSLFKA
jgi:chromosomal replication initiation ATPase DnaA